MNTHRSIPKQVITSAYALVDKMPPLNKTKDPTLAGIAGFALGAIGLGLYFGTVVDFLVPVGIWLVMMAAALPTGGTLLVAAPVFCAVFGYRRAKSSNARLSGQPLTAEIVVEPRSARKI